MRVAIVFAALSACSKEDIWLAKIVSPDGKWVAGARTEAWSGPGVGAALSAVCLARSSERKECTDVIVYPPNAANQAPEIKWLSDDELVVRIPDPSKVALQTVKFGNVRIQLEALSKVDSTAGSVPSVKQ